MKTLSSALVGLLAVICGSNAIAEQGEIALPASVIFENVRIFDGTASRLSGPSNVLVVGNVIKTISSDPIPVAPQTSITRIQGNGRTLMPGLIDNHVHIFMAGSSQDEMMDPKATFEKLEATASKQARVQIRSATLINRLSGRDVRTSGPLDRQVKVAKNELHTPHPRRTLPDCHPQQSRT
jgi:imidazolonepropionase-like amidohydrolase